jgi:hypothetical protein
MWVRLLETLDFLYKKRQIGLRETELWSGNTVMLDVRGEVFMMRSGSDCNGFMASRSFNDL